MLLTTASMQAIVISVSGTSLTSTLNSRVAHAVAASHTSTYEDKRSVALKLVVTVAADVVSCIQARHRKRFRSCSMRVRVLLERSLVNGKRSVIISSQRAGAEDNRRAWTNLDLHSLEPTSFLTQLYPPICLR